MNFRKQLLELADIDDLDRVAIDISCDYDLQIVFVLRTFQKLVDLLIPRVFEPVKLLIDRDQSIGRTVKVLHHGAVSILL